jgi:hypothetical protein
VEPDLVAEFMDKSRYLSPDVQLTSMNVSKFIKKDFKLILVDQELKKTSPKLQLQGSDAEKYDFAHGKSLLQSMMFDALTYPADVTIDLCIEIFDAVLRP